MIGYTEAQREQIEVIEKRRAEMIAESKWRQRGLARAADDFAADRAAFAEMVRRLKEAPEQLPGVRFLPAAELDGRPREVKPPGVPGGEVWLFYAGCAHRVRHKFMRSDGPGGPVFISTIELTAPGAEPDEGVRGHARFRADGRVGFVNGVTNGGDLTDDPVGFFLTLLAGWPAPGAAATSPGPADDRTPLDKRGG